MDLGDSSAADKARLEATRPPCPGLTRRCGEPAPSYGRPYRAPDGTQHRLCLECSAEADDLEADARSAG